MSQANSDFGDGFDDGIIESPVDDGMSMGDDAPTAPPVQYRKQEFNIYSIMLILSFVFLTTAAIIFYMNASKF